MFAELITELCKFLFVIAIIYTAITYAFKKFSDFGMVRSTWQHPFDFQFSTQEFYASVEAILKERKIPGIETGRKTYSQTGIFSSSREYLRIVYEEEMVLICAAPFGTGAFVSFRSGEWMNHFKDLVPRIPAIGMPLARALFSKTYYQMDSASMFSEATRLAVLEAIDRITNDKGLRPLTELERMPQYLVSGFDSKKK